MNRLVLALILSTASVYGFTANDAAKTVTSDGSLNDTQNAIWYADSKAQDGWHIIIGVPGGVYTWNGNLDFDGAYTTTLRGASPTDRPKITQYGHINQYSWPGKIKTQRDIIFVGSTFVYLNGTGVCFRLTNIAYVNMGTNACGWVAGPFNRQSGEGPFGLIDHCQFVSDGPPTKGFYVRQNEFSPDQSWGFPGATNAGFSFGTNKAVYFEDNTATSPSIGAGGLVGGNSSAKVVVRNNVIHNNYIGFHGPDSSGPRQSAMQIEMYRNAFTANSGWYSPMFIRGGTAYVFENNIDNAFASVMSVELHCTGGQAVAEGCKDCDYNLLGGPLVYPQDYPQCQMVGHPDIPKPRVWSNIGPPGAGVFNGAATGWLEAGRNYHFSVDDAAAPVGYTPYQYPHPMNTGGVPQPPTSVSLPIISGVATQGQMLTGSVGFWTWDPIGTFAYQWRKCDESGNNCANISGATTTTYTTTAGDIGSTLRFVVNATNASGGPIAATSVPSAVITAPGAQNRIANPGFEQWSGAVNGNNELNAAWTGWTSNAPVAKYIETNTYEVHSGSAAFKFRSSDGTARLRQNFVPAQSGQEMAISFWYSTTDPRRGVTFRIYDRTSGSDVEVHGPVHANAASAGNTWTKYTGTWTVPEGCTSAALVFTSENILQLDNMRLDDVVVAPPAANNRPEPPQNLHVVQP